MKTSLKSLEMKGLRSFVDPTSIQFPENGLLLLMGPSGSGKSTIFLGIAHGMGNCPYPASELQSWNGDQKLEVKLGLSTSEGDVTIVRGPKSYVEGAVSVQGASNINPTIQKLTGLNQELLSALTYRPQKTPGLFLSKSNAEMQEFLSILLGLNKFDAAIEQSDVLIKEFESKLTNAKLRYELAQQEYDKAKVLEAPGLHDLTDFAKQEESANEICSKLVYDLELQSQKMKDHRAEWDKKQAEFAREKQEVRSNYGASTQVEAAQQFLQQVETRLKRMVDMDVTRQKEIRLVLTQKHAVRRAVEVDKHNMVKAKKDLATLEAALKHMKETKCPTCKQPWTDNAAQKMLEQTEAEIADNKRYLGMESKLLQTETDTINEITELEEKLTEDSRIEQMRQILKDAQQKLQEAKLTEQRVINEALASVTDREKAASVVYMNTLQALTAAREAIHTEYRNAENVWNEARLRRGTVEVENRAAIKERDRIQKLQESTQTTLNKTIEEVKRLENDLAEELDLREMIKSFLTAIFDEVLDQIAYSANEMMAQVPNIAHITIAFKSETMTQKGTVKRAITPFVNIGGGARPLRSALSGGMASAVELAVDLAVRKVISARSGAVPGWLILDECFEGLGVADKEACLELLKQASQDTLILVIDHSSETKELFSQTITVENTNGRSKISEG